MDFIDQEGSVVNIRAKRVSPGVPVAFLVKAIAGTYRRYLPEVKDVCLAEYDPGEAIGTATSETFERVFEHTPVAAGLLVQGMPVLNLSGLDRRQAVQALENFFKVWQSKSPVLGVEGLQEDPAHRAFQKWCSVYRQDYLEVEQVSARRSNILLAAEVDQREALNEHPEEHMPGKIFLLNEDNQ